MPCKRACLGALWLVACCGTFAMGCGGASAPANGGGASGATGSTGGGSGNGASGTGGQTAGTTGTSNAGSGAAGGGGSAGTSAGVDAGLSGTDTFNQQFPNVTDWGAIEIVYPSSYSGFDGVHTFKVPMRARCEPQPLSAWHADPATAVVFDPDPDNANGVMVTIVEPTADITIAVVAGTKGGKAPLHVTVGTPEQWMLGDTRYHSGSDWTLNVLAPTAPPPDTKCTVCHSENSSSGFDVQHTPTQAARISDEGMTQIMTTGTKPADIPFRVIPDTIDFAGMTYTNVDLYKMFHLWQATPDQLKGMILYLRSLTPLGQGCVTDPTTGVCQDVAADPTLECKK